MQYKIVTVAATTKFHDKHVLYNIVLHCITDIATFEKIKILVKLKIFMFFLLIEYIMLIISHKIIQTTNSKTGKYFIFLNMYFTIELKITISPSFIPYWNQYIVFPPNSDGTPIRNSNSKIA